MNCRKVTKFFTIVNLFFCAFACGNNTDWDEDELVENTSKVNVVKTLNFRRNQNTKSESPKRKWITQLFNEAETSFDMDSNVNAECKRDFGFYKLHLRNQSIWAVRMLESSEWPSVGIFSGMMDHLGNYDECLTVSSHGINGQYCLAQAKYDIPDEDFSLNEVPVEFPNEELSAWKAIAMYQYNPVRVDRRKLKWALCIPSSCKARDLQISLNSTLYPIFRKYGFNVSVNVNPLFCKLYQESTYSQGFYNTRLIFIIIFLLVISCTCYECIYSYLTQRFNNIKKKKNSSTAVKIIKCFSIVENFKNLIIVNPKTDYAILHAIKVMNMIFILFGHRFIYFIGYPRFNTEAAEKLYRSPHIELVHSAVVDVFFMVSGFLTFYFGFSSILKGGGVFLFLNVVFRWIRIVPVFGILMLYIIYILPFTGEGPLWDYRMTNEVNMCKGSWWTNLLVINNVVKTDQQCLIVSWYIANDIQLAAIGGILLLIYTRSKKWGIFSTLVVFLTATIITFTVAYINKFHGIIRLFMSVLEEPRKSEEFINFYIAPYTRAGPYLVGFAAALVTKTLRERNFKFSRKQLILFSASSFLICEGIQHYAFLFYIFGREYNRVENALYAAIRRPMFVFMFALHVCMYFTSGLDFMNILVELKVWVPFGRLTYSVFLLNTVIQLYHASSQKHIIPISPAINFMWFLLGDIILIYFFGLVLHLFAEAPILNLSKLLQKYLVGKLVKPNNTLKLVENIDHIDASHENIKKIEFENIDICGPLVYHDESYVNSSTISKT